MNTLPIQDVIDKTGLSLIIDQPTIGDSKLDKIFTSDPMCYKHIKIVKSCVKSNHSAIFSYNGVVPKVALGKTSTLRTFRKKSPMQHAYFFSHSNTGESHFKQNLCQKQFSIKKRTANFTTYINTMLSLKIYI